MACSSSCPLFNQGCAPANPFDAIEGDPYSRLWVVGIKPKIDADDCMDWGGWKSRSPGWSGIRYFFNLGKVLGSRVNRFGLPANQRGLAHTDLLKCGAPKVSVNVKSAIPFCSEYLVAQVDKYLPDVIFCNGVDVCDLFVNQLQAKPTFNSTIWYVFRENKIIYLIFTGFVTGWLDRWSAARILKDVDAVCLPLGL